MLGPYRTVPPKDELERQAVARLVGRVRLLAACLALGFLVGGWVVLLVWAAVTWL